MKSKTIHITDGSLYSSILRFAAPIMLSSFLQTLFVTADITVVGNMAHDNSVAAIGVNTHVISLLVNSIIGISSGINIILSRSLGANNRASVKKIVDTALLTSLLLGLFVAGVSAIAAPYILSVIDCPPDIFDAALTYLRIYLAATPFIIVYNFATAIVRVSGDSDRPLYYMILSGVLNILLNFLFCLVFEKKVVAVALATLIAQAAGAILTVRYLLKFDGPCKTDLRHLTFSLPIAGLIFRYGIPAGVNSSLYSIANLQIQSAINSFGPPAIAGNTSAATIEGFINCICTGFSAAILTFVGQNLGAGNFKRVKGTIRSVLLSSAILCLILGPLFWYFSDFFLGFMIPGQTEAMEYGKLRLLYLALPVVILSLKSALLSVSQAFGYPFYSPAESFLTVLVFRFLWMKFIYPLYPQLASVYQCFLVSWSLSLLSAIVINVYILLRFNKGIVRKIKQ